MSVNWFWEDDRMVVLWMRENLSQIFNLFIVQHNMNNITNSKTSIGITLLRNMIQNK